MTDRRTYVVTSTARAVLDLHDGRMLQPGGHLKMTPTEHERRMERLGLLHLQPVTTTKRRRSTARGDS
jgi:hypothetical protein